MRSNSRWCVMKAYEREFFVYRILSGLTVVTINGVDFEIRPPSYQDLYYANRLFMKKMEDGGDVLTDNDIYEILISDGRWSPEEEDYLKNMETGIQFQVEQLKIKLYEAAFRSEERAQVRKYLDAAKKEQRRLISIRHSMDHLTLEGVANYSKSMYIIENCTYLNGQKYDWSTISPKSVLKEYYSSIITDDQARELARTEPWQSIWSSRDSSLFKNNPLTDAQIRLVTWSKLYDSVAEAHETPHRSIIDDDDMLDGWLIKQKRERDKEKIKKRGEELITNPKIANADEIFIVAQSKEDAKQVTSMNNPHGAMIQRNRMKQVRDSGHVKEANLSDVKLKRRMNKTRQYMNRGK